MTAVSLQNVYKLYNNVPVVDDLSLVIKSGEIFGLLGPNGAGKSTTIRMLTTLTKPTRGQIQVANYDVVRQPHLVKQCIGVVLQQMSLDQELTVWENLELHGRLHHIPHPQRQRKIQQYLEYVELSDRQGDRVKALSGGMMRRLQIARALLHEPQILFLDEPTVGLDPQSRRRIWGLIRDLNQQGMTILLTTHYMEEVEFLCETSAPPQGGRIGIVHRGKLIELGSLPELKQRHGEGLLMSQEEERWHYQFFPTLEAAQAHLETQPDKLGMMVRPVNLEDIFVELTGRNLE